MRWITVALVVYLRCGMLALGLLVEDGVRTARRPDLTWSLTHQAARIDLCLRMTNGQDGRP